MKVKLKPWLILLFCCLAILTQAQNTQAKFPEAGAYKNTKLSYKIIPAANNTFAYDIYSDSKLIIHQPSIPGLAGNEGFRTKAGAEKVARLVTAKIDKGEMPPTVTMEEMKKLKAIP
jgi:hypothetical protein